MEVTAAALANAPVVLSQTTEDREIERAEGRTFQLLLRLEHLSGLTHQIGNLTAHGYIAGDEIFSVADGVIIRPEAYIYSHVFMRSLYRARVIRPGRVSEPTSPRTPSILPVVQRGREPKTFLPITSCQEPNNAESLYTCVMTCGACPFFHVCSFLADANFPVSSVSRALGARELREDGHSISDLLEAILKFFPLDAYVDKPLANALIVLSSTAEDGEIEVAVMDPTPSDKAKGVKVTIWDDYRKIIEKHEPGKGNFDVVERFAFYERAKRAYAVVQTG
uniref:L-fucose mutarotase n=1 Tax=Timema genevievae TaxID=629358 RepID=A0A7R9JPP4_TIMGE|nr:unnamed protein product [Timema genevievae]